MINSNFYYSEKDKEALKIIDDFLPEKIYDAHAHLSSTEFTKDLTNSGRLSKSDYEDYFRDMMPIYKNREFKLNVITEPDTAFINNDHLYSASVSYLEKVIRQHENCCGEIVVMPNQTKEEILNNLVSPGIVGFKCYHTLIGKGNTFNADINDYLPESAWEIANERGLCITLHMVKDGALADKNNMNYIIDRCKKYPNATLILAHSARAFAAWTCVESVRMLKDIPNVFFDFSAICESPSIFSIIKETGTKRCMWGSDYSCNMLRGKAISLADGFYWIYNKDLDYFNTGLKVESWLIGIENLMALRQACIMADLTKKDVEDIFYNNADNLFSRIINKNRESFFSVFK